MPSLHVAAALLVFWNRAAWRQAARLACAAFLLWTMFSTMALGEHYLIDLVPSVPLTLIFYAAFSGPSPATAGSWRLYAMLSGAALTAGWLLMLRFWVQPLLAWPGSVAILSLATVGVSVWMQRQVSALTEEQVAS